MQTFRLLPKIFVRYSPEAPKEPAKVFLGGKDKKAKHHVTDEQVLEIRWLVKFGGKSYKEVASMYNIVYSTVRDMCKMVKRKKVRQAELCDFPPGFRPEIKNVLV